MQASSVMLLIGLAVGVDYSMFYVKRQREERAAGRPVLDAIEIAAATSGRSVLISGLTVLLAMSGMFLTGSKIFYGIGPLCWPLARRSSARRWPPARCSSRSR